MKHKIITAAVIGILTLSVTILNAESGVMPSKSTEAAPVDSQPVPESPDDSASMTLDEMKAEIIRLTNIERIKASLHGLYEQT